MSQGPAGSWPTTPDGIKLVSVEDVQVPTFKDEVKSLINNTREE